MFNHWTLKKRLMLTFTGILLLAGALISVALVNNSKLRETVNWNTHTYKVLAQADSMLLNMVNIETGLRGFVAGGAREIPRALQSGRAGLWHGLQRGQVADLGQPCAAGPSGQADGQPPAVHDRDQRLG
jgi:CHASE3 domain sensor protein